MFATLIAKLSGLWTKTSAMLLLDMFIIASIPLVYNVGHSRGETSAKEADALKYNAAIADADLKYRAQEANYASKITDLRVEFAASATREAISDAATASALADGSKRVRIQIARCRTEATTTTGATTRVDEPSTAELPAATAAALYAIAADGDTYARQLTALQSWAREAVKLCNGGK